MTGRTLRLPAVLAHHVSGWLRAGEVARLASSCVAWYNVLLGASSSEALWRRLFYAEWPGGPHEDDEDARAGRWRVAVCRRAAAARQWRLGTAFRIRTLSPGRGVVHVSAACVLGERLFLGTRERLRPKDEANPHGQIVPCLREMDLRSDPPSSRRLLAVAFSVLTVVCNAQWLVWAGASDSRLVRVLPLPSGDLAQQKLALSIREVRETRHVVSRRRATKNHMTDLGTRSPQDSLLFPNSTLLRNNRWPQKVDPPRPGDLDRETRHVVSGHLRSWRSKPHDQFWHPSLRTISCFLALTLRSWETTVRPKGSDPRRPRDLNQEIRHVVSGHRTTKTT